MVLPALDLILQNLIALIIVVIVLMLLSQLVTATILGVSGRFLRSSLFKELTPGDRDAFRKHVRRSTLGVVALLSAAALIGAVAATFFKIRSIDLVKSAAGRLSLADAAPFTVRIAQAIGIVLGALVVDTVARAAAALLGRALERLKWFVARKDPLSEALDRLRAALRYAVLCGAAVLIADLLELPPGVRRAVVLISYVLVTFYTSRVIVSAAHLAVDLVFDMSGRLSKLESPLKYLGSLTHLTGITKRAIEYFVYVGAATWVADELTPDTWPARAGRVGIRIIAIFYASRVVVELCVLFVNELFLARDEGKTEVELQQRRTLVPVAVGFLRYGIYFSAVVMVLREASIDPTPLLAGAGVIGVAIGLGAQAFVGDIVAGFFILFENLILVGDLVEVGGVKGKVEEIGVRITRIRDDSGVLHAIPNGEVRKVSSHSKAYVNAVVDVYVPYEEDMRRVRDLLAKVTEAALQEEPGAGPQEVKVQELAEGSVLFRVSARVPPGRDEDVSDVLRARLLDALRDAGVGAPRARRAVLIDDAELRITSPSPPKKGEEESQGPPKPFEPPSAGD
jgi:small-conductance mechanosensitive channel